MVFMAEKLYNARTGFRGWIFLSEMVIRMGKRGKIVLPKDARKALGIKEGDTLLLELAGGKIILKPLQQLRVKLGTRAEEIVRETKKEELKLEEGVDSRDKNVC
jgi:AbrB family looped-hinge helix DNA binding protein